MNNPGQNPNPLRPSRSTPPVELRAVFSYIENDPDGQSGVVGADRSVRP